MLVEPWKHLCSIILLPFMKYNCWFVTSLVANIISKVDNWFWTLYSTVTKQLTWIWPTSFVGGWNIWRIRLSQEANWFPLLSATPWLVSLKSDYIHFIISKPVVIQGHDKTSSGWRWEHRHRVATCHMPICVHLLMSLTCLDKATQFAFVMKVRH